MMPDQDNPQKRAEEALQLNRETFKPLTTFLERIAGELPLEEERKKWQKLEQDSSETVGFHYVLYSRPLNSDLELHVSVGLPQLLKDHPDRDNIKERIGRYTDVYTSGTFADQFPELVKLSNSDNHFLRAIWPERFEGKDLINLRMASNHLAMPPNPILPLISQLGQRLRHTAGLESTNWTPIAIAPTVMSKELEHSLAQFDATRNQAASLFQLFDSL